MKEKINKFIHSKNFIIILILLLISLVGIVGTYAWFTWSSTENTSLTLTIGKLADVTFDNGNDINITNLAPVFNYTDGEKTTFSINNKDTTGATISYSVKLNITTIASELVSSSLKYKLMSNGAEIGSGDFSSASSGKSLTIGRGTLSSGITDFDFYIYIDGNIENDPNIMNKTLIGTITVTASEASLSSITLANLGLSVDTSHTPDFSTVSGNNGVKVDGNTGNPLATGVGDSTNGIYASEDDLGTSYYFRGAVENNYVYFANFYWRIIRINGDGTVRMIYAGTSAHDNGYDDSSTYDTRIGTSDFNTNYNDNAYVGYMYGTAGSSTYAETHSNTNNSTIKTYIDNWYQNNLSSYSSYIADAIYCNDRSVTPVDSFAGMTFTGTGIGTEDTAYSNLKRNYIDHTPSLKCTNINDRFTVENNIGNTALTYPVGLITLDEAAMAGGLTYDVNTSSYITNMDYYLFTGYWYWTMTPDVFAGGFADVGYVNYGGFLDNSDVGVNRSARPVVSLRSDAISGGSGTMIDPFVVR